MVYLESFSFPDGEREFDYALGVKRTCYVSLYPFGVLPRHRFERLDFEPVTILCGSNGCGKSTALNAMAKALGIAREAGINDSCFFEDYAAMCRADLRRTPKEMRVIASDDVFEAMLGVRAINSGVDRRREELFDEYVQAKRSGFQLRSMDDYEELARVNRARKRTQSRFVREELGEGVRTFSNGESAFRRFAQELGEDALYLLDEPENSLSAARQRELAQLIEDSARFFSCQFVIATHSPFMLAIRGAKIYDLDDDPVDVKRWTDVPGVRELYDFFKAREREFGEE